MDDGNDKVVRSEKDIRWIAKQTKRISLLEKTVDEMRETILILEAENAEKSKQIKKSDYNIIQSIGTTFLDRKKKGRKAHLNSKMRPVFTALMWELWKEHLSGIVDGDDKEPWDINVMDKTIDDHYDETIAKSFFNHVYATYLKRIQDGIIIDVPSTTPGSSATSTPVRVAPSPTAPGFVYPPEFSNIFRFGVNDLQVKNDSDSDEEEEEEQNGAKGG